jgi:hypothetical protein
MEIITDMLKDGPQKMKEVITTIEFAAECSKGTIKAAAKKLNVVKKKVYNDKGKIAYWTWELPPQVMDMSDFMKNRQAKGNTTP